MKAIHPGPLMIDIDGCQLSPADYELIAHPNVGGIVLFTRNYENIAQLQALIAQIRAERSGELLIAVDHEGGRVQRFREGFTSIPAMREFGDLYEADPGLACALLCDTYRLIAVELAGCDIDFSFSPCIDIDHEMASVIGDRALHHSIDGVVDLARAAIKGFKDAGMACVIKHFPGHGSVESDTHLDFATDSRTYAEISSTDMAPFVQLIAEAKAVMPAHVIYSSVDQLPASLSSIWQYRVLRKQLGFSGAIVSDDLSMRAATGIAHQSEAAVMAAEAGTDLALICNDRAAAVTACDNRNFPRADSSQIARRLSLRRKNPVMTLTAEAQKNIRSRLQLLTSHPNC